MTFRLPTFKLTVRDLTHDEWASQCDRTRDYYAVEIVSNDAQGKDNTWPTSITLIIGGPVIQTQGSVWNEAAAARSAISFASAPWCADNESERQWMEIYGEALTNEAFCHRVLGRELRQ